MTARTCALCGHRDAAMLTDFDGRRVYACLPCLSPVPDPPEEYEPADLAERFAPSPETRRNTSTRDAVFAVIAASTEPLEARDIAAAVGASCPGTGDGGPKVDRQAWRPYEAVLACLSRAVKRGQIAAEWIQPGAPTAGRRYSMPKEARHAG